VFSWCDILNKRKVETYLTDFPEEIVADTFLERSSFLAVGSTGTVKQLTPRKMVTAELEILTIFVRRILWRDDR